MKIMELTEKKVLLNFIPPLLVLVGTWGGIGKYGFMDDYALLESSISGRFNFLLYFQQGRPFSAAVGYLVFSFIDSINALIYLHILGSVTLAFFAWLLFTYFKQTVQNNLVLVCISVIPILLSPGLLLVSSWAVMSPIGGSLFPAVAAAFLIRKSKKVVNIPVLSLLIFSFLSYPPSAGIFMCLPCLSWLLSTTSLSNAANGKELISIVKRSLQSILIAGIASLVTLKVVTSQFDQTSNRTELIGDVPTKVNFLLNSAIPTAVDYFEPNWGFSNYGWLTIILLLSFLLLCNSGKKMIDLIWILALGIGGTFAPLILTAENWPSNRALYASQWMIATLTIIAIYQLMENLKKSRSREVFKKSAAMALLMMSIYHSNNLLITTMKVPQLKELDLARSAIAKLDPGIKIEVKKSEWTDSIAPWLVGDEFGIPSTCQTWVPVPMSKLILKELYPKTVVEVVLVDELKSSNSVDFSKILNPVKK